MDVMEGRIRADHLNIELVITSPASREPQKLKLYNMLTLAQKIQLWFFVGLLPGFLIINITSIASSFHLLPTLNLTCQCPRKL